MAVDDFSLLPKAPPPRPSKRDEAIEAALRRFDGVEDRVDVAPGAPLPSRWSFGRSPQFGALVTASLILAIGLPATIIAIRDGDGERAAPQSQPTPARNMATADAAAEPQPKVRSVKDSAIETPRPPAPRPEPDRMRVPADEAAAAEAVSPPVVALAPPPPPATAAPAPSQQKMAEAETEESQIVVTGSRVQSAPFFADRRRNSRARSSGTAERDSSETPTAPDWVMRDASYRSFLNQLQAAVRSNDRAEVVRFVTFPLRVNFGRARKTYRNADAVLADYDRIFTPRVRGAILAQRFEHLFGRDQGVMIGDGAVWFDHTCRNRSCSPPGPVRIRAINP